MPYTDPRSKRFVERHILSKMSIEDVEKFKKLYPIAPREVIEREFKLTWREARMLACYLGVKRSSRTDPFVEIFFKGVEPLNLSDFDLGFIVGFFEGEGSITVLTCGKGKGKNKNYGLRLNIVNTDKRIIEKVHNMLGMGFITERRRKKGRTLYELNVSDYVDVYRFLITIRPHLVTEKKRKLADLVLEYLRRRAFREPVEDIVREIWCINGRHKKNLVCKEVGA